MDKHPFNGLFFQDKLGKLAPERSNQSGERDNGVAVAAVGPHASDLHLATDR